jgi:hypothetical protein
MTPHTSSKWITIPHGHVRPKLFKKIWPNNYLDNWCKVSKIMRAIDLTSKKESKVLKTIDLSIK